MVSPKDERLLYESGGDPSDTGVDTPELVSSIDEAISARVLIETELTPKPLSHRAESPRSGLRRAAPSLLTVRLADTEGHRNEASYLVRKMYGWRGYGAEAAYVDPNCVTLVASTEDGPVATITVGFDSAAKLAAEDLYPEEVALLRAGGASLCEFTRLAVERTEHARELLAMLFHIAYIYARRLRNCSDLLIEVNPRHARFYARMLGFKQIGAERLCIRVDAPAILLRLPLRHAEDQIERHGGRGNEARDVRSLYPLFFSPHEEEGITARLRTIG